MPPSGLEKFLGEDWASKLIIFFLGLFFKEIYGLLKKYFAKFWKNLSSKRQNKKIRESYGLINSILNDRIEIIQTGWLEGIFLKSQIQINLEKQFSLLKEIQDSILHANLEKWKSQGFQNNIQCGVFSFEIDRIDDSAVRYGDHPSHQIKISAQSYNYFEAKCTNFSVYLGENSEILTPFCAKADFETPPNQFPNPLSVGLSLFCENGNALILTQRTQREDRVASGQLFNAVGEMCNLADLGIETDGKPKLSIFKTASRGLLEEIGLDEGKDDIEIALHTFCWDRHIYDYKFFGIAKSKMDFSEIEHRWRSAAPDKSESRSLIRISLTNAREIKNFSSDIFKNKNFSAEAKLSSIMGLIYLKKLSIRELEKIASKLR